MLAVTAQLSGAGAVREAYRRELAERLDLSAPDLGVASGTTAPG